MEALHERLRKLTDEALAQVIGGNEFNTDMYDVFKLLPDKQKELKKRAEQQRKSEASTILRTEHELHTKFT